MRRHEPKPVEGHQPTLQVPDEMLRLLRMTST